MASRVITRDEVIAAFAPLRDLLHGIIDHAREQTTLERFAKIHPEIQREAGLKRLAGQARWILVADGLAATISSVAGFGVSSTEAQHNSGQYIFGFPGGIFTVRREPHDEHDPDDGKYLQEALVELLQQAELAPEVDADAPIVVYLSVTQATAVLKVCHPTLSEIMKIAVGDLTPVAQPLPADAKPRRARARSTRVPRREEGTDVAGSSDSPS